MKKKMLTSLFLCTLCFVSLVACGQDAPMETMESVSTWQEQYDLGLRYLSEGNYEEAIIAFTTAIEIDPKQAPAYVGRGDAYGGTATLTQDTDAILEWYQRAAEDYQIAFELGDETAQEKLQAILDLIEQLQSGTSELLQPLYVLFSQDDLEGAKALMRTDAYRELSASLIDGHYEYTENGVEFVAVYPNDYYYYGSMESGQRSGNGLWLRAAYGADSSYESQTYYGEWVNDLPNGEGTITTARDLEKMEIEPGRSTGIYTEIQGSFMDGLYHGTIYETCHMNTGDVHIWSPITAINGVYQPYENWLLEEGSYDNIAQGEYMVAIAEDGADLWGSNEQIHQVPGVNR